MGLGYYVYTPPGWRGWSRGARCYYGGLTLFAATQGLLLYAEERNPARQKANPIQLYSLGAQQMNGYGRGETVVDT